MVALPLESPSVNSGTRLWAETAQGVVQSVVAAVVVAAGEQAVSRRDIASMRTQVDNPVYTDNLVVYTIVGQTRKTEVAGV